MSANNYNPNKVFPPELKLIKISLLEDGWTQPIVVFDNFIVDGFHRWTLVRTDAEVEALTDGEVPVVRLTGKSLVERMMATVRHNRARGQHGILRMGEIVRAMAKSGLTNEVIAHRLQMEQEEIDRLSDLRGSPDKAGKESFGKGWEPA